MTNASALSDKKPYLANLYQRSSRTRKNEKKKPLINHFDPPKTGAKVNGYKPGPKSKTRPGPKSRTKPWDTPVAEKEIVKEPSSNDDSDEVDDPDEIPEISSDESDLEESRTQDKINKQSSASKNSSVTKSKTILIITFVKKNNFETNFV